MWCERGSLRIRIPSLIIIGHVGYVSIVNKIICACTNYNLIVAIWITLSHIIDVQRRKVNYIIVGFQTFFVHLIWDIRHDNNLVIIGTGIYFIMQS